MEIASSNQIINTIIRERMDLDNNKYCYTRLVVVRSVGKYHIVIRGRRKQLQGIADESNTLIVPVIFDNIVTSSNGGLFVLSIEINSEGDVDRKLCLFNALYGKMAYQCDVDEVKFNEESTCAVVIINGKKGLYDYLDNRIVLSAKYDNLQVSSNALFRWVHQNGRYFFVPDENEENPMKVPSPYIPLENETYRCVLRRKEFSENEFEISCLNDNGMDDKEALRFLALDQVKIGRIILHNKAYNISIVANVYGYVIWSNTPLDTIFNDTTYGLE